MEDHLKRQYKDKSHLNSSGKEVCILSLGKWIRNQMMSSLHSMVLHSFIFLIDVIRWPLYTVLAKSTYQSTALCD